MCVLPVSYNFSLMYVFTVYRNKKLKTWIYWMNSFQCVTSMDGNCMGKNPDIIIETEQIGFWLLIQKIGYYPSSSCIPLSMSLWTKTSTYYCCYYCFTIPTAATAQLMSLLPLKSLSGTLPVIFVEARVHGPPEIVFSQLGISIDADQCNIAILSKFW